MQKSQKVVLVTGTSSGLGHAISLRLAADGHRVYGTIRAPRAQPLAGVHSIILDVTCDASVHDGVSTVVSDAGRIDVLINNAGIGIAGAIEDTNIDEARLQFETNFFGTHRLCRAVLPYMRAKRAGYIINMSSLGGLAALPFQAFYSATKFAIEAYTEALRVELRAFNIAVSMIEPGDFATRFTSNRRMTAGSKDGSPYQERFARAISHMAEDEQRNTDLTPVVRAVVEILAHERPALRYPCASLAPRALIALKSLMPQHLFEYLMLSVLGID